MPDDQSEVIAFLADPATHGGAAVTRIDTHSAHVFLAGDSAVKIKRAVRYDYLDFSTLALRHAILLRECALNARAAPAIYRDVVAITREADGRLALGGAGEAVEFALRMNRFPAEAQLDRLADTGRLDGETARALGEVVADYHGAAERRAEDGAVLIGEILDELARVFAGMEEDLGAEAIAAFGSASRARHAALAPLLSRRTAEGHVRRCHGDLHLSNIVLLDGRPVPFDALEFDERLGTCDTGYDLAFLLMDLDHRGLHLQANLCLNAWLARTGDHGGLACLPLFLAVRAAIRAMVEVQTARATRGPVPAGAGDHLAAAIRFLAPAPPCLVAVGGLSGTGKTTVARDLAPLLPPVPGAVHLRSDEIRKELFHARPLDRLPPDGYGPQVTARVYDRLVARARTCLAAGHSVILDATFLEAERRAAVRALVAETGVPAAMVWLTAPAETCLARVAARQGDASDADAEVLRRQLALDPGAIDWTRKASDGAAPVLAREIRDLLPAELRCVTRGGAERV